MDVLKTDYLSLGPKLFEFEENESEDQSVPHFANPSAARSQERMNLPE